MYWESFAFEEPELPPQPIDIPDLLTEKEPDSASEGGEESEEGPVDPGDARSDKRVSSLLCVLSSVCSLGIIASAVHGCTHSSFGVGDVICTGWALAVLRWAQRSC